MRRHTCRSVLGAFLLLTPLTVLPGCGLGTDVSKPEWAKVVLTASKPVNLQLLTSKNFLVTEASVQLVDSSTVQIVTPFEETYTLGSPARIFLRVTNNNQQTVTFNFQVFMEDRNWMNEDEIVAPGEKVEFVYRYDEPVLR